ncbi:PREDICTED: uncharacterized protein LOC106110022 [Papilio polytes]|uniref:uncharacterized protein LOC106110022 n=1 Tax=Papilio polytes TaxID=76194 RepID=UPI0006768B24|nr:PREDICTED: uncharacterized protein LOC106110022 [Papilio polytes]
MKLCSLCNTKFTDGVQCASCKKVLDFGCANISESGWRKLGADRRAQWRCASCKLSSPVASALPAQAEATDSAASLETILREIRDMKRQLTSLPTLVEEIRLIKDEISELKAACDISRNKVEEFNTRLLEVEAELAKTKHELTAQEQRSRLNNVEIKGIPLKKGENLFSLVDAIGRKIDYVFPKSQINYISRVPMYNSNEKLIIVSFLNRYIKEDFIAAARSTRNLSTTDLGLLGAPQRVFVNDHLSADSKKLLTNVKNLAKEKHYEYVWVKHGKIHVRKNNTSKAFVIVRPNDLNKVA